MNHRPCIPALAAALTLGLSVLSTADTTHVSGMVAGEWPSGVYVLDSSVTIGAEDTLFLNAGVTVLVDGYNTITVKGVLLADGELDNPVRIVSAKPQAARWDWDRIHFKGIQESFLKCCVIKHSNYGVFVDESSALLMNCLLDSNSIHSVYVRNGAVTVLESTVRGRQVVAVYADRAGNAMLEDCHIYGNHGGVGCNRGGRARLDRCTVTRNTRGLIVHRDAVLEIADSRVAENAYGISCDTIEQFEEFPGLEDNRVDREQADPVLLTSFFRKPAMISLHKPKETEDDVPDDIAGEFKAMLTPAQRLSSRRPDITLGVAAEQWSRKMTGTDKVRQVSVPLSVFVPFRDNVGVRMGMALGDALELETDERLTGPNDLRLQGMYVALNERLLVMGGLNIPLGKNELSDTENEILALIGDEDLLFDMKHYGEGFGVNLSAAFSDRIGSRIRYAVGAGYYFKGPYDRLESADSRYDPADVLVGTGGIDLLLGPGVLRYDITANYFTPESENDEETYQLGGMLRMKLRYLAKLGKTTLDVAAHGLYRAHSKVRMGEDNELHTESEAAYGNHAGFDAGAKYWFTRRLNLGLAFDIDAETPNGYDRNTLDYKGKTLLAGLGGGVGFAPLQPLFFDLAGRCYMGSIGEGYALSGGIELRGWEVGVVGKYQF